jgi:hypothetical protein
MLYKECIGKIRAEKTGFVGYWVKSLSTFCHSGLDLACPVIDTGESSFFWIPAGVYPDEDRSRNDEIIEFMDGH